MAVDKDTYRFYNIFHSKSVGNRKAVTIATECKDIKGFGVTFKRQSV